CFKHSLRSRFPLFWRSLKRVQIALKDTFYKQVFEAIHRRNTWGDPNSVSGQGSNLDQTRVIRRELPLLTKNLGVNSMLDIPCGDCFWMKEVNMDIRYTGGDIVPALIEHNQREYSNERRRFALLDLLRDPLPKVDLVLCRDCLVHFSFRNVFRALENIRISGSTYLLTTTFTARERNVDIETGNWRPINLEIAPFSFPSPVLLIAEECPVIGYEDKHLAMWKIS